MVWWLSVCMYVCIMYICLPCCFWKLMYIMTTRSLQVDIICVRLRSRMYEHDDLTHDFVDLLTNLLPYLLTSLLTYSQTHNLPCMHTYVMIPVIWSGTILLVAFITTISHYYDQNGYTAMILAANNGHMDIVEYLVSQGADKDIKDDVSTTLVHVHLYNVMYIYIHLNVCMYMFVWDYGLMVVSMYVCCLYVYMSICSPCCFVEINV